MLTRYPVKIILILALGAALAAILAGCNLPRAAEATPDQGAVQTQVAVLLTSSPAAGYPQPAVTATGPAGSTPAATAAPETSAPATETPQPGQEPKESPTPSPTATAVEGDPRQTLGDPTFQDTKFKEGVNWGSAWKDDFTQGQFKNNELVLTSIGFDGWTVSFAKLANFYVEMTATTGNCSGMDRYGLIARVPDTFDTGYLAGLTCDGQYSLRYWDPAKKKFIYLIDWTASDAIHSGSNQTNRLGLMAQGDELTVYANGHKLGSATDSRFTKGLYGPFIGHTDTEDFTIYIKEIAYWDLP